MANNGAFPNESEESVKQRYHDFTSLHEEILLKFKTNIGKSVG